MPALEASALVGIVGVGLAVGQTRHAYTDFKTNRVLAEGQDARTTGLKKIHQHMHLIKEKDIIRLLNVHDRLDTRHYNLLQDYGYYSLIGWWKAGSLRDESIAWKVDALRTSDISLKHNMGGEGKASGSLQSSEFQLRDNASEAGPSIPMNILSSASPADVASTVVNAGREADQSRQHAAEARKLILQTSQMPYSEDTTEASESQSGEYTHALEEYEKNVGNFNTILERLKAIASS